MRCTVKRLVSLFFTAALLASSVPAQQLPEGGRRANPGSLTQITIAGKRIAGDDVLVRKGTAYVSVPALLEALGGSLAREGNVAVISVPAAGESDRGDAAGAKTLSAAYRKAAVRIPDTIEILRTLVYKHVPEVLTPRFDALNHDIATADLSLQTDADKAVSYALSNAANKLEIAYYKMMRGVPPEAAKQGQLDSVLCSMESKFALQVGRLSGQESCSVFVRARGNAPADDTE